MTTLMIILGGFALLFLLFLFVSWRYRDFDEYLKTCEQFDDPLPQQETGDDIYGPSLMNVEDCKREGEKKCDDHR